jgi:hypothetical protein
MPRRRCEPLATFTPPPPLVPGSRPSDLPRRDRLPLVALHRWPGGRRAEVYGSAGDFLIFLYRPSGCFASHRVETLFDALDYPAEKAGWRANDWQIASRTR